MSMEGYDKLARELQPADPYEILRPPVAPYYDDEVKPQSHDIGKGSLEQAPGFLPNVHNSFRDIGNLGDTSQR